MVNESGMRWLLVATMVPFMAWGMYHRIRSHTGEPLKRRDEGWPILIGLRLTGLVCAVGLFTYLVSPDSMRWAALDLPPWARWSGWLLIVLSCLWVMWMMRTLGKNLTDTVTVRANATLVTSGPYRWVRHPMYVGLLGITVGLTLMTDLWILLPIGILAFTILLLRSRTEEAKLEERFGQSYREWKARTGFVLPKWTQLA